MAQSFFRVLNQAWVTRNRFPMAMLVAACSVSLNVSAEDSASVARTEILTEIRQARAAKRPSRSVGTLRSGRLENPAELPKPAGAGYFISHPDRDTNFGADQTIFGLLELGLTLRNRLGPEPHHRVLVNEISDADGGKQQRHINHQMGLDVDLGFYTTDVRGNQGKSKWLTFDKDGLSPGKTQRFDVGRNWELVELILENENFTEVRAILIAEWLKEMLLTHAAELARKADAQQSVRIKELIRRGTQLMRQPTSSPHDNHFHLSLTSRP